MSELELTPEGVAVAVAKALDQLGIDDETAIIALAILHCVTAITGKEESVSFEELKASLLKLMGAVFDDTKEGWLKFSESNKWS